MTLTRLLREELAHQDVSDRDTRVTQASAMVRPSGRCFNEVLS